MKYQVGPNSSQNAPFAMAGDARRARVIATGVAVAVFCVASGGCGTTASVRRHEPVAFSAALAYAKAVELRQTDVGDWREIEDGETAAVSGAEKRYSVCTGGVDPARRVVSLLSPVFKGSQLRIWSEIRVMPTAALAQQDLAASVSARAISCFGAPERHLTVVRALADGYTKVRETLSIPGPPVSGLPGGFGLRITETYGPPFNAESFAAVTDIDGFVIGPAEMLVTIDAPEPFPETEKYALLRLLHRAEINARLL
jgi:hypothetical protein